MAALLDNDARIARAEGDAYAVECKPHGHGDVHSLLYSTGKSAWKRVVRLDDEDGGADVLGCGVCG